jgi:hypothetical protein
MNSRVPSSGHPGRTPPTGPGGPDPGATGAAAGGAAEAATGARPPAPSASFPAASPPTRALSRRSAPGPPAAPGPAAAFARSGPFTFPGTFCATSPEPTSAATSRPGRLTDDHRRILAAIDVPDIPDGEAASIRIERADRPDLLYVGADLYGDGTVSFGHWPQGEEWESLVRTLGKQDAWLTMGARRAVERWQRS